MKKLLLYTIIWPGKCILLLQENVMSYYKPITDQEARTTLSTVTYGGFLEKCKIQKALRKIIRFIHSPELRKTAFAVLAATKPIISQPFAKKFAARFKTARY
jgi:hypothetical protein